MVSNFVNANYTETYDLNTIANEMSLLAIHTPQAPSLKKMFKGYFSQYKKFRINGCSFKLVCSSQLPLNAQEIGLESGQMDPRDAMNPILFKACTGDNINVLLNQIYNEALKEQTGSDSSISQHLADGNGELLAYYQMLADPTWRKAHPMAGLTVKNLRPFVHKVVTTQPFKWVGVDSAGNEPSRPAIQSSSNITADGRTEGFGGPSGLPDGASAQNYSVFVSAGVTKMPWLDTAVHRQVNALQEAEAPYFESVATAGNWLINNVPRVYMGCLLFPPSISTKWYMRLLIRWSISFKEFRPAYEVGPLNTEAYTLDRDGMVNGATTYWNLYHNDETSKNMDNEYSSFSSNSTEAEMLNAQPL